jgi:hypothetical protein
MGWRSEIRNPEKLLPDPDPGVKKALDPGSGSAILQVQASLKCSKINKIANFVFPLAPRDDE